MCNCKLLNNSFWKKIFQKSTYNNEFKTNSDITHMIGNIANEKSNFCCSESPDRTKRISQDQYEFTQTQLLSWQYTIQNTTTSLYLGHPSLGPRLLGIKNKLEARNPYHVSGTNLLYHTTIQWRQFVSFYIRIKRFFQIWKVLIVYLYDCFLIFVRLNVL